MCVCVSMKRPERVDGCIPLFLPTFFFKVRTLVETEFTTSASGIHLSPSCNLRILARVAVPSSYMRAADLNEE